MRACSADFCSSLASSCGPWDFQMGSSLNDAGLGLVVLEIALFSPFLRSPISKALLGITASLALAAVSSSALAASSKGPASKARPEASQALPKGDVTAGRQTFAARCSVCHGADAVGGVMAPNLTKAFGAKAAGAAFARYSASLKASGLVWTPTNLDGFLTAPGKAVPGTTMMTAVANPADRTNLIAYLASLNSGATAKDRR